MVGKYRYHMTSPADSTWVPLIIDIILVGRTKIITLHSGIWVENAIDRQAAAAAAAAAAGVDGRACVAFPTVCWFCWAAWTFAKLPCAGMWAGPKPQKHPAGVQ